jgi:hypothetical protein
VRAVPGAVWCSAEARPPRLSVSKKLYCLASLPIGNCYDSSPARHPLAVAHTNTRILALRLCTVEIRQYYDEAVRFWPAIAQWE